MTTTAAGTTTTDTGTTDAAATAAAAAAATAATAAAAAAAAAAKDGTKAGDQTPAAKAPDKYELKMPEGTSLGSEQLARIEKSARALNLPNEAAQKMLDDLHTDHTATVQGWLADTTADKTYGGEKLAASQQLAKSVIDRVRPAGHPLTDAFNTFLNSTGAGNRIEVLAFLADLGKLMAEDSPSATILGARSQKSETRDPADVLYGGTTK